MTLRPCPRCGRPRRGDTCGGCGWTRNRKSPTEAGKDHTERTRRAAAVAEHRERYGDVCPGYRRRPHPARDLTADHLAGVAETGRQDGPLTVLCRSCNSRRGAERQARGRRAR